MIRNNFIVGVVVVLLVCGLTVSATQGLWKLLTDSARVHNLAQRIAAFDLPEGYQADYAVEMLGYSIVAYKSANEHNHLAFLQAPPGVIPEGQMIEGFIPNDRTAVTWHDATVVHAEQRTIRDQAATITVSDRTNSEGQRYRSLNMVFEGREGAVLLVMNQPVSTWDDAAVEAFITSIR